MSLKKRSLLLVCVVMILGMSAYFLRGSLVGFFYRAFASPSDYVKFVCRNNAWDAACYINKLSDIFGFIESDGGIGVDINITPGEYIKDIISDNIPGSFSDYAGNIDTVKLDVNGGIYGDLTGSDIMLSVNGESLTKLKTVIDMTNQFLYVSLPDFSSKAFRTANPFLTGSAQMMKLASSFRSIPEKEELADAVKRYTDIALSKLDGEKVVRTKEKLAVGDLSQKCTLLTVAFDRESTTDIIKSFLIEAKDDELIKEYIRKTAYLRGMKPDDALSEFERTVSSLTNKVSSEDFWENINLPVIGLWVDKSGKIAGVSLKTDSVQVSVQSISSASGEAVCAEIKTPSVAVAVNGTHSEKDGMQNGNYTLCVNGVEMADIYTENIDSESIEKGDLNGKVQISASDAVAGFLKMADIGEDIVTLVQNGKIVIQSDAGAPTTVGLYSDGRAVFEAVLEFEKYERTELKIPDGYVDYDEFKM